MNAGRIEEEMPVAITVHYQGGDVLPWYRTSNVYRLSLKETNWKGDGGDGLKQREILTK